MTPPAKVETQKPEGKPNVPVTGSPGKKEDVKPAEKEDKSVKKTEDAKAVKKDNKNSPAKEIGKEAKAEVKKEVDKKPEEKKPEEKKPEEKKPEEKKPEVPKVEETRVSIEEELKQLGFDSIMHPNGYEVEQKHEVHSFACSGISSIIQVVKRHDPELFAQPVNPTNPEPSTLPPILEVISESPSDPTKHEDPLFLSAKSEIITQDRINAAIAPPPTNLAPIPEENLA